MCRYIIGLWCLFAADTNLTFIVLGGRIIFFSTSLTHASAVPPNYLIYTATKGAVEQMTRILAKEYGAKGITVNCVAPGPIDTELFRNGKSDAVVKAIENVHPAKRIGQPDEVSPVVAFLVSDAASWVNGQNLMVNGVCQLLMIIRT